jgi:alkylhydroperoxidase family enzyme
MAHVPLLEHPKGLVARLGTRYSKRRFGQNVEPTEAAAHHAGVLLAMGSLETAVQLGWKKLDPTLRWLAVQATGMQIGCSWRVDYGYYKGMHRGIDPAKVRAVGSWRTSNLFEERERVVLEYAETATSNPAEVSDELAARIRAYLSDAEFVELAAWVALENFRSRFNAGPRPAQPGILGQLRDPDARRHHGCRCLTSRLTWRHSKNGARCCSASLIGCWAVQPTRRTWSKTPPSVGCDGTTAPSNRCAPTSSPL